MPIANSHSDPALAKHQLTIQKDKKYRLAIHNFKLQTLEEFKSSS